MNNLNLTTSNSLFELSTTELELIDGDSLLGVIGGGLIVAGSILAGGGAIAIGVGIFGGIGTIIGSL